MPNTRSRTGPGDASAGVTAAYRESSRATTSMNRTIPSAAPSGSAVRLSPLASPSGSIRSVSSKRSTTAGSDSSATTRLGSSNPSRAMAAGKLSERRREGSVISVGRDWRSQRVQVALELERGDVVAVVVPLLSLVAEEEVEELLAEGLG